MSIDQRLKDYALAAFTTQALPIKLIADICDTTEEEIERILQDGLVDKDFYIKRSFVENSVEEACRIKDKEGAQAALYFLVTVLGKKRQLTQAEQDHALTLKLPQGFEPEPE